MATSMYSQVISSRSGLCRSLLVCALRSAKAPSQAFLAPALSSPTEQARGPTAGLPPGRHWHGSRWGLWPLCAACARRRRRLGSFEPFSGSSRQHMSASAPSVLASRCPAGSFSLFGDANVLTGDVFSVSSRAILCSSARTGSPKHKPRHRASRTPELFGRARAPHKGGWTCVALGTVLRCTLGGSARPWSGDTRPALPAVSYLGSYKPPRCLRYGYCC